MGWDAMGRDGTGDATGRWETATRTVETVRR